MPAEPRSSSSLLVRSAGGCGAAILVLVFAIQAAWATGVVESHFEARLSPLAVVALTSIWTLGGAALLLTRVGVLTIRLPRWFLRAGTWALAAFLAWLGMAHLVAVADRASGAWHIDLQGPLLLLLAGLCIVVASEQPSG